MEEKLKQLGFYTRITDFWGNGQYFIDLRNLQIILVTKDQEPFCKGTWNEIIEKLEEAILGIKA